MGFKKSYFSDCLFIGGKTSRLAYLETYVDDILVTGQQDTVDQTKRSLSKPLNMQDLVNFYLFFGIRLDRRPDGILTSQRAYTERILKNAELLDCKHALTLLLLLHPQYRRRVETIDKERKEMENIPFRNIIGALIFFSTRTRLKIATAVLLL